MLIESVLDIFDVPDNYVKVQNCKERNSLRFPNWETAQIELELNQFDNKNKKNL